MLFWNYWARSGPATMIALCLLATAANAQTIPSAAKELDDFDAPSTKEQERVHKLPEVKKWHAEISTHIARVAKYPLSQILAGGGKGKTLVDFRITRDGSVLRTRLREPSGNPAFDEAAVRAIRAADPFPAAPPAFTLREADFTAPIAFEVAMPVIRPAETQPPPAVTIIEVKAAAAEKTLSPSVEKSLTAHINQCVLAPTRESYSFRLKLERDGSISEPPTSEDKSGYGRTATTSTASELMKCKPFSLNAEFYDAWRDIIVTRSPAPSAIHSATTQKKATKQ